MRRAKASTSVVHPHYTVNLSDRSIGSAALPQFSAENATAQSALDQSRSFFLHASRSVTSQEEEKVSRSLILDENAGTRGCGDEDPDSFSS